MIYKQDEYIYNNETIAFKPAMTHRGRKGHIGACSWHLQMVEKRHEIGVVDRVKNDKSGINGETLTINRHINSMAVSAHVIIGFKYRDLVVPLQQPCR